MSTGDDTTFARRMRMRREGLVMCGVCPELLKPDKLDSEGECPLCAAKRSEREAAEQERVLEDQRREHIQWVRAAELSTLSKEDLCILAVAEGAVSAPQAADIARNPKSKKYTAKYIRHIIEDYRRVVRDREKGEADKLNKRIAMSTRTRVGKTRTVLSEALQRASEGGTVSVYVANKAMVNHYALQIQALVPHAVRISSDGTWQVGVDSRIRILEAGRNHTVGKGAVVDPDVELTVAGGGRGTW